MGSLLKNLFSTGVYTAKGYTLKIEANDVRVYQRLDVRVYQKRILECS